MSEKIFTWVLCAVIVALIIIAMFQQDHIIALNYQNAELSTALEASHKYYQQVQRYLQQEIDSCDAYAADHKLLTVPSDACKKGQIPVWGEGTFECVAPIVLKGARTKINGDKP